MRPWIRLATSTGGTRALPKCGGYIVNRFIRLERLEDSEELRHMLLADHNAFILLTIIASRARRCREPSPINGTRQLQALIGDYKNYGLSERNYRTAKEHLEKWGLVTIETTNRGTIATLCNGKVFDINPEEGDGQPDRQTTDSRQAGDGQTTTKNNERKPKCNNEKNESSTCTASSDAENAVKVEGGSYCGLKGDRLNRFEQFWTAFDYKRGKAEAAKTWKQLEPLADDLLRKILDGAKRTAAGRGVLVERGQTSKMAQGWLSGRRWEDEPLEYSNQTGGRRYDKKGSSRQATRKVDSVGRAAGRGLPVL